MLLKESVEINTSLLNSFKKHIIIIIIVFIPWGIILHR